jgi:hypothetical protein
MGAFVRGHTSVHYLDDVVVGSILGAETAPSGAVRLPVFDAGQVQRGDAGGFAGRDAEHAQAGLGSAGSGPYAGRAVKLSTPGLSLPPLPSLPSKVSISTLTGRGSPARGHLPAAPPFPVGPRD